MLTTSQCIALKTKFFRLIFESLEVLINNDIDPKHRKTNNINLLRNMTKYRSYSLNTM